MKPIIKKYEGWNDEYCEEYEFTTGTKLRANCGYIGLNPFFTISEGYDGEMDADNFTRLEMIEMAEYMIELWREFKKRAENKP